MSRNKVIKFQYLFLAILLALTGCKKHVTKSNTSYIIGDDNMKTILPEDSAWSKYTDAINSSVLVVTKTDSGTSQFCSGVIVNAQSTVKVLTNHHCFAVKGSNGLATENYLPGTCRNTSVYFNVIKGALDHVTKATCIEGSFVSDFFGDLAIFSIEGDIPQNARPLNLMNTTNVAGNQAFIIHYPAKAENFHSVPKFSTRLPIATVTEDDCKIIGEFPKNEWNQVPVLKYSHRHSCDLIQGSSGSPLLDLNSKNLLGVNWGGIKVQSGSNVRVDNAATNSAYVAEFLSSESPNHYMASSLRQISTNKQEATQTQEDPACGSIGVNITTSGLQLLLFWLATLLPSLATFYIRQTRV